MWLRLGIILVLLLSFQTTLLDLFSVYGVRPDLALILTVYCAIILEEHPGIAVAFTIGFLQDCLSGGLLGVNTLSKSLIGFAFANLKTKLVLEGPVPVGTFLAIASIFDGLIYYLTSLVLFQQAPLDQFFPTLLIFALYNALVGVIGFYFLNRYRGRKLRFREL